MNKKVKFVSISGSHSKGSPTLLVAIDTFGRSWVMNGFYHKKWELLDSPDHPKCELPRDHWWVHLGERWQHCELCGKVYSQEDAT